MDLFDYEIKNSDYLRQNGAECAVLLENNGDFPLTAPEKIALYGSGARQTLKGGTGSGEVNSRFFINIENGLTNAGFEITSKNWLDGYDKVKSDARKIFVDGIKQEAKEQNTKALWLAFGRVMPEPEYELPLDGDGETAIYVVSRICGEGSDRQVTAGDILLSDTEIRDILACKAKYKKFMLVLNVGGPVDLTPVKSVENILVLSQLGCMTGDIFADILLGKQNPSGKLTTTWSKYEDYPFSEEFGDRCEVRYKEGIYVGYRYFDSVNKKPVYSFGYGKSYTSFSINDLSMKLNDGCVQVTATIANTGAFSGKETLQVYVSVPEGKLDQPVKTLAGFAKSELIDPGKEDKVTVSFNMADIAGYDEENARYILEAGEYVVLAGNSSENVSCAGIIKVQDEILVMQAKNSLGKPDFTDFKPSDRAGYAQVDDIRKNAEGLAVYELTSEDVIERKPCYDQDNYIYPEISALSDELLVQMNIGAYNKKIDSGVAVGDSAFSVAGAAGETTPEVSEKGIKTLVMADGPAGLRLAQEYCVNENGGLKAPSAFIQDTMRDFLTDEEKIAADAALEEIRNNGVRYQYATAIPIGTAIAQSFNVELAQRMGDIVGGEMEMFGIHLWLAPALNLHRNIRCGRNFEYFSEDPLVSGSFAAALTLGVQAHKGCGTTIKHFALNNQEYYRTTNNSIVSERTARETYLRGFEVCVRKAQPHAVMTSYNLINGTHSSERRDLTEDILRAEWGYKGMVMTDWVMNVEDLGEKYPIAHPSKVAAAGGDIFMPGFPENFDEVMSALKSGILSRKQLEINASHTYRIIKLLRE